jgi:hypothetical protein
MSWASQSEAPAAPAKLDEATDARRYKLYHPRNKSQELVGQTAYLSSFLDKYKMPGIIELVVLVASLLAIPIFMALWALLSDIGGFAQKKDAPTIAAMGCGAVPVMWVGQGIGWALCNGTRFSLWGLAGGGAIALLLFYGISFWNARQSN